MIPEDQPQHDHPDGPAMGWSAAEMADVPRATPAEVESATETVADGTQEDD